MIEASLYSLLSTASAITSLIGTRIYPVVMPEDATMPALLYYFVGGSVQPSMDTRGIQRSRLQFDCFGDSYSDVVTLRDALIQTIAGYTSAQFSSQILSIRDTYDHDLTQYIGIVEAYLTYPL